MAIVIENNCVGCTIQCIDCGRKHEEVAVCDECGSGGTIYKFNSEELCIDCIKLRLEVAK